MSEDTHAHHVLRAQAIHNDTKAALTAITIELEHIVDGQACDHAIGMCWCDAYRAIERARAIIGPKT